MIRFELKKNKYKNLNFQDDNFKLKIITSSNYDSDIENDMKKLILYFNEKYEWENMFKIEDVKERVDTGDFLYISYFNHEPIGYVWFKKIENSTLYLYNLFVTKIVNRPHDLPKNFVNRSCGILFENFEKIQCVCETWNFSAQKLFLDNNFVQY